MEDNEDLEKRVDRAVDEMRSHVEELEKRRDDLERRTEEARQAAEREKDEEAASRSIRDEDGED